MVVLAQLGMFIPTTSTFFLSYIFLHALTVLPLELCQLPSVVITLLPQLFCRGSRRGLSPPPPRRVQRMQYHIHAPMVSFAMLVGLVFSTVAPLVLPGAILYFAIGRVVWAHQLSQVRHRQGGVGTSALTGQT
jgi:hypothetical protein